jgi:hypothetical protein
MATPLSSKLPWEKANPLWAQVLSPIINAPLNNVQIISNYSFKTGKNVLNHGLGKLMLGWFILDPQGLGTLYRSAPFTTTTLTLTSSADFTASLGVF